VLSTECFGIGKINGKETTMRRTWIHSLVVTITCVVLAAPSQADWQQGVTAFKGGDLGTAAREFKTIVDAQPDWPGGHFMLGWTLLKQKKNQEALTHLRRAYDLNPADANYQLRLGEAYVASGRYSDAVAFLSKIDSSSLPADLQGFLAQLRALALTKTGQSDQAYAEFAKAARANPNDADAQYHFGTAAYNDGSTQEAVDALAKATRLDANDPRKWNAYAKALNRLGRESRGDAKVAAYRRAVEASRKVVSSDPSYENLVQLGEALLGARDYDGAVTIFQQAVGKSGSVWLPQFYIGQAYTAKKQYRSAESALKSSLERATVSVDQVRIWRQLGFVYEAQQSYDDAIAAYRQAGDDRGVERVEENRQIAQFNQQVDSEAEQIRRLQEEQEAIRRELEELPGGPPPGF
jgi:tetratricopeptide (TPR) repeat protein